MLRVFVTRDLPGPALDRLRAEHEIEVWDGDGPPPADVLAERSAACEGLLSLLTDRVDASLIESAPELRAISNFAVGVDNIDVEAASSHAIPVGHTPEVLTDSTADLAIALMLAVARRLPEGERAVRDGHWSVWSPEWLLGRDLHGATVGIIGGGRIGMAVARRLEGFDCEVLVAGRGGPTPLAELLGRSDFVSLHVPLNPGTQGLIDEVELRAMRDTAYLVNTARGPLVNQAALASALEQGWIAGAALDVTDPEPLPPDDPLLAAPNLLVIPHLGSATHHTRAAMAESAVSNLLAGLAGEPMPHCVNPEVYSDR
ncbi:MAG: 2-hydroxyacid dehydrogenase [Solirubrobacterales bacterium]